MPYFDQRHGKILQPLFNLNQNQKISLHDQACSTSSPPFSKPKQMTMKSAVAIPVLTLMLGACAHAEPTDATHDDPRIQELTERTLRQMVFIEGGSFEMGDWCGPKLLCDITLLSRPLHKVTLDSFSIMAYQVNYTDFDVFTDTVGAERINMDSFGLKYRGPKKAASPNWYGAKAYCQWLGELTGLPFDLPTEAQWEYAARSRGQKVLFATDNGKLERGRNFPPKWEYGQPKPPIPDVGSYPPNPAGLYGMSEGMMEWVNDWYATDYYQHSPERNPQGPEKGTEKVKRGAVGGEAESANLVMMRTKATPRKIVQRFTGDPKDNEELPGYNNLPGSAVRCVINSPSPVKRP